MPPKINPNQHIGKVYSRLTVLDVVKTVPRMIKGKQVGYKYYLNCQCSCGRVIISELRDIVSGHTRSCGCLLVESNIKRNFKHGETANHTTSPEWKIWSGMVGRCYIPSNAGYYKYGAVGITVCDRWNNQNGFATFLADMGRKPTPRHTIDRIDGTLGCFPENCRWATPLEQSNNQRSNIKVLWHGEIMNVSQLMRLLGIYTSSGAYYSRLKRGWSIEKTFTTPIPPSHRKRKL